MRHNIYPFAAQGGKPSDRLKEELREVRRSRITDRKEKKFFEWFTRGLGLVFLIIAIFACVILACVVPLRALFWF